MSFSAWLSELNRILIVFIPAVFIGLLTGYLPLFFILGLIIYGLWTAAQLDILKRWLDSGAVIEEAPEFLGIADHHVTGIVDLQKNNLHTQNNLEELISQFNAMISAIPDAVVIMTSAGEIITANEAAHYLLQIDTNVDAHNRITQLIRNPSFIDYFSSAKFDEPLEIRGVTANEPELSLRIISFGDDKLVLIAQDMTQTARIYEMRRSFISNASHELRTPLTVILGYLETLETQQDLPQNCISAIQSSVFQAQRMKQLVEDLLTLSRLESRATIAQETDSIPVVSLIAEVVSEATHATQFTNHIIKEQIETDAMLEGNLQEIHSVISNLVNNAIKHTEPGTSITICWKLTSENYAELIVEDDGNGIAPEHIDRLTERFYRVDVGRSREKGGTGLGLSIVKHVVNRHEGTLSIASEQGEGSTFTCQFPPSRLIINGENLENQ